MNCNTCGAYVPEDKATVGPNNEGFCDTGCRNAWIWKSQSKPSVEVSAAMAYASDVAQKYWNAAHPLFVRPAVARGRAR